MKKNTILIGVILVIAAGITLRLISNKKHINQQQKTETNTDVVIPVNAIEVQQQTAQNNLIKTGTLIPFKEADITAVGGGKIVAVNFELGSFVSQGAVVARLDNSGLQLNLQAAQLAKDKAEKDYNRFKTLLEGEATTEMNFQDAQLNFKNSKNQIEQIQKQMADNLVKAPLSGQVVAKYKQSGEFAGPGTVFGHIVDVSRLKVDVLVSEGDVYKLKTNQTVTVTTDVYPGIPFEGKINFISENGDAVHNYQVEVSLQNKKDHPLKAGSFAYVDFHQNSAQEAILIPKSALIQSMDKPMVYVIQNDRAVVRNITLGSSFGNNVEVVSGLNVGEKVITTGLVNVSDSTRVKVSHLDNLSDSAQAN